MAPTMNQCAPIILLPSLLLAKGLSPVLPARHPSYTLVSERLQLTLPPPSAGLRCRQMFPGRWRKLSAMDYGCLWFSSSVGSARQSFHSLHTHCTPTACQALCKGLATLGETSRMLPLPSWSLQSHKCSRQAANSNTNEDAITIRIRGTQEKPRALQVCPGGCPPPGQGCRG